MKILHAVLSQGFYGSERYCAELATEQARDGHDVEIIIHGAWSNCAREMRKSVALANTVGAGTLQLVTIPAWAPTASHRVLARRAIGKFQPDVVHTHLNAAVRRVGREAQELDIPHISTLHLPYDKSEVGSCDGLVCVAGWQLDTLNGFAGEIIVAYNWVPTVVLEALAVTSDQQVLDLRNSWGVDDHTFVLGTVGRLTPAKGIDRLVRVLRTIFPRGDEDVRLVIVGDGDQRDEIVAAAVGDPRIIFAGTQENVAPFYRAFDTYVNAARFEPFGLAILEAMAAGCPLVLTRTESPSEFIRDPRVLWSDIDDDITFAARLIESVALGPRRLTYNLKPFSQERTATQIEALYLRTIKRRQS